MGAGARGSRKVIQLISDRDMQLLPPLPHARKAREAREAMRAGLDAEGTAHTLALYEENVGVEGDPPSLEGEEQRSQSRNPALH